MVYLYDACDQISDFCHQQLLRKMRRKISWKDGRREVKQYTPSPFGERGYNKNTSLKYIYLWFQSRRFLEIEHKISPLQLVNLHRNRRYFVIKLHTWFCLSYFLKTNIKLYCIYQYFMSINSFFQHRICFSIQPQLQLVNLHRNRRYFVIKLYAWFCLSYFLKTNIKLYCIYQYFMSINSFFNTVSVSRYSRPITVIRDPD